MQRRQGDTERGEGGSGGRVTLSARTLARQRPHARARERPEAEGAKGPFTHELNGLGFSVWFRPSAKGPVTYELDGLGFRV